MTFKEKNKLFQNILFASPKEGTLVREIDNKFRHLITYVYKPFLSESNKIDSRNLLMSIPNRSYQEYIDIENCPDYDFSSNLVLEMLIRNKIFIKFSRPYLRYEKLKNKIELTKVEKSIERKYCKLKKAYSQYLGLNMDHYNIIQFTFRGIYTKNFSFNKYNVDSFPRLCDIKDGLERAIKYYYEKDSICKISLEKNDILLDDVLKYYSNYRFLTQNEMLEISEEIPISDLDDDFIFNLSESDLINNVEKIKIGSIYNDLEFIGSKIVNINLNMNLPLEELIAHITKIKEEYSKSKNPLEILKKKIENISNPKSLALIPKNNKKRKKTYADAFYIYDLFQCIDNYFYKMRKDIKNEYNEKKLRIKADKSIDSERKKSEIKNITNDYKIELNYYNKDKIYDAINEITNIEVNKARKLHKLLKEYIEDLKYKNIISNKE
ncbi:hypothetical protein [Aliarcobacter butzleri]|uniref:hypothetical protein n=1 Tax=Aliarcobacter butzleri TaxID=28197 RepID=UPI00263D498B|nr:hypothetical protein [Aliarcobacter butzleri]MDN5053954.1 hypothetical protein [Aliarcobacter butzleri]